MTHFLRKPNPRPPRPLFINEQLLIDCISLKTKPPPSPPSGSPPAAAQWTRSPRPRAPRPPRSPCTPAPRASSWTRAPRLTLGRSNAREPQAPALPCGAGPGAAEPRTPGSLPARPACGRPAPSCGPSPARRAPARTGGRARLPAGRGAQTARRAGLGSAGRGPSGQATAAWA